MTTFSAFFFLVAVEWRKLSGRTLLWGEVALLGLLTFGLYAALIATLHGGDTAQMPPEMVSQLRAMLSWPGGLNTALAFAEGGGLGGLFIAILAGAFSAQEYTWRTVHLWLTRGVRREFYLLAKFAVLAAAAGLLVFTTVAAGGLVSGLYTLVSRHALPWGQVAWGVLGWHILLVAYTLLPYTALAFVLGVFSRSAMIAIGVTLGYSLLLEGMVLKIAAMLSPRAAAVVRYCPAMLSNSVLQTFAGEIQISVGASAAPASTHLLSAGPAAGLIALYAAALVALALWAFRRQDIAA